MDNIVEFKYYVRDPKGRRGRIGLILGRVDRNAKTIRYGWSLCSKNDHFSPSIAEDIAKIRLNHHVNGNIIYTNDVPHTIQKEIQTRIMPRSERILNPRKKVETESPNLVQRLVNTFVGTTS